jgi:RNA polymerase sigma factor (sigma-70 family)
MPTSLTTRVVEHFRLAGLPRDGTELGDGELLRCFVELRDEAAIAALITRHGPMVWGVCRRLLNHHEAEDAFQATFLVLVRKAASVAPREMVANWLYGVAHQTALQARRTAARRSAREVQVTAMPDTVAAQQDLWSDLQPLLDQELSRLPDNYRVVIVLCDLESRTRKEVARQLGVPEGTVAGRLVRARAMLAKRLTRRGVVLSSGALAVILSQNVASAGVPALVVSNTIKVASPTAAGQAAGVIPVKVSALTEGVLKAMFLSKIKSALAVALVVLACVGGAIAAGKSMAAGRQPPRTEKKGDPGKETDGEKAEAAAKKELAKLQGVWTVASYEVEGKQLPDKDKRSTLTIARDKWVIMWVEDDENVKAECGVLKIVNPEKSPLAVDFVHLDGRHKGSTVFAIVRVDGDTLKFCYRDRAEDRPTEFKTKAGDESCGLVTFNRQKK